MVGADDDGGQGPTQSAEGDPRPIVAARHAVNGGRGAAGIAVVNAAPSI